jgi:hypothetical protein
LIVEALFIFPSKVLIPASPIMARSGTDWVIVGVLEAPDKVKFRVLSRFLKILALFLGVLALLAVAELLLCEASQGLLNMLAAPGPGHLAAPFAGRWATHLNLLTLLF